MREEWLTSPNSCLNSKKASELDACALAVLPSWTLLTDNRVPDGKVCLNELGELAVTKFAVEPVRAKVVVSFPHSYSS